MAAGYALRPATPDDVAAINACIDSIYLYTHQLMIENRALYVRIGYIEYERRVEDGLLRVYVR